MRCCGTPCGFNPQAYPSPTATPPLCAAPAEKQELAAALLSNFALACKLTGFPASKELEAALQFPPAPEAQERDLTSLTVRGHLGAPNVRALCAALLARGSGLAPRPYKFLKRLMLQDAAAGDSGAAAVAEVLRNGCLVDCTLEAVTLLKCGVEVEGAAALGSSLMLGACTSLSSLCLDLNAGLGDAGLRALCKGLATNRTLTRLSLAGCGFGCEGAEEVAAFINSPTCILEGLDLSGNDIGLEGLRSLAVAASYSKTLLELLLCNCGLSSKSALEGAMLALARRERERAAGGGSSGGGSGSGGSGGGRSGSGGGSSAGLGAARGASGEGGSSAAAGGGAGAGAAAAEVAGVDAHGVQTLGAEAFSALGRAVASAECALGRVDLDGNPLTASDAAVLVPFLKEAPAKVTLFRVPVTLSPEHFAGLFKNVVAKGKKKGGGKKK